MSQDVKYSKIICYRTEPSAIWQIFYESHILQLISWSLSHSFPMLSFPTHWKHWKTVSFSDVFRGQRKGALGTNGLRWKNGKIWEASKMLVNNARGYYVQLAMQKYTRYSMQVEGIIFQSNFMIEYISTSSLKHFRWITFDVCKNNKTFVTKIFLLQ